MPVTGPLRHLKTYPTDGQLHGEDLADHKIAPGVVPDGYALQARAAAANAMDWGNDGAAWINVPLRYVLIASSAEVSNTAAVTDFSKTIPLSAGEINTQGIVLTATAAGKYSTKASSPGVATFFLSLVPSAGATGMFCYAYTNLNLSQIDDGWSISGSLIVRATGNPGTLMPHAGYAGGMNTAEGGRVSAAVNALTTLNLTAALTVYCAVQFTVADPANKATMQGMTVSIARPGAVVS